MNLLFQTEFFFCAIHYTVSNEKPERLLLQKKTETKAKITKIKIIINFSNKRINFFFCSVKTEIQQRNALRNLRCSRFEPILMRRSVLFYGNAVKLRLPFSQTEISCERRTDGWDDMHRTGQNISVMFVWIFGLAFILWRYSDCYG